MRVFRNHPPTRFPSFPLALLFLILLLGASSCQGKSSDFVFPAVDDLAIGDSCTIAAAPRGLAGVPYARHGICQRVRDCPTFVPRVILEPFDIRRDVCFFEVHDPVVCCVHLPVSASQLQFEILRRRLAVPSEQKFQIDINNMIH